MTMENQSELNRGYVISNVQFRPSPAALQPGILGWISCVLNGDLLLNNLVVVRKDDGKLELHYPTCQSSSGHKFFIFNPQNASFSEFLEKEIFRSIRESLKYFSEL